MADRRKFLKMLAGVTASMHGSVRAFAQSGMKVKRDPIGPILPTRKLGATGKEITILGLGGSHVSWMEEKEAEAAIEAAIEEGVRFFDTAEGYGDGLSETRYGKYLTPKYREHIFLMSKVEQKDYDSAMRSLDASLERLKTDYLDLWQIHTLESVADVEERVAGGILKAMEKAKASGKVRHIGFTGHATPDTHALMLEKTDIFETCQMPINVCDRKYKSFIDGVLPTLVERNMGVLAMKTLGEGGFFNKPATEENPARPGIVPDRISILDAFNFVWSLPVSTIITGPDNADMLREKVKLINSYRSLSERQRAKLIDKVADLAETGTLEDYKYG